jgi:hypothetical protein
MRASPKWGAITFSLDIYMQTLLKIFPGKYGMYFDYMHSFPTVKSWKFIQSHRNSYGISATDGLTVQEASDFIATSLANNTIYYLYFDAGMHNLTRELRIQPPLYLNVSVHLIANSSILRLRILDGYIGNSFLKVFVSNYIMQICIIKTCIQFMLYCNKKGTKYINYKRQHDMFYESDI